MVVFKKQPKIIRTGKSAMIKMYELQKQKSGWQNK